MENISFCFKAVAEKEEGIKIFHAILSDLGYFAPVFASGAQIYANAALRDAAGRLERLLEEADPSAMAKIKALQKYYSDNTNTWEETQND